MTKILRVSWPFLLGLRSDKIFVMLNVMMTSKDYPKPPQCSPVNDLDYFFLEISDPQPSTSETTTGTIT